MLARSFLIESSSKLLVTKTGIKAWWSSILGRIRPLILELLALEWWKFHTFWTWISLKPVGQSWSNFMCSITGVGERLHKVARLTLAHWTQVSDRCFLGYLFFKFATSQNTLLMSGHPLRKYTSQWWNVESRSVSINSHTKLTNANTFISYSESANSSIILAETLLPLNRL